MKYIGIHDAFSNAIGISQASDLTVCHFATKERRIILSLDKDFLSPVISQTQANIVVCHFPNMQSREILPYADLLLQYLEKAKLKKPFTLFITVNTIEIVPRI